MTTYSALAGFAWSLIACVASGCAAPRAAAPHYVTTVQPLAFIVRELAAGRAEVRALLSPKDSPHTYTPLPRDIAETETAIALVMVDESLDGWSRQLPARRMISVFAMTPEDARMHFESHHGHDHEGHDHDGHDHNHEGEDPHFWTDPQVVMAVLPELVKALSSADPEGAEAYARNGAAFQARLAALDAEIANVLEPVRGGEVVLMHPSLGYMLHRYGLELAAVIEPSPGREPSARDIVHLIEDAREAQVKALFTEPQLPKRNAEVLAESLRVPLFELDPNGGGLDRDNYEALLRYNAHVLREALS